MTGHVLYGYTRRAPLRTRIHRPAPPSTVARTWSWFQDFEVRGLGPGLGFRIWKHRTERQDAGKLEPPYPLPRRLWPIQILVPAYPKCCTGHILYGYTWRAARVLEPR